MSKVQVVDVEVLNNPSEFCQPFQFQITFDCLDNLGDDLEWKIIYVGSAESEQYDQVLDSVLVGPIPAGRHKFVFQADPPNPNLIPTEDVVGVTVVIITCTYHNNEFVRVGYYVNNEYLDAELRENLPEPPQFDKLRRNILSSAPRVTRFKINWDDHAPEEGFVSENMPPENVVNNDPVFLDEMSFESHKSDESSKGRNDTSPLKIKEDSFTAPKFQLGNDSRPKRYDEDIDISDSIDALESILRD